MVNEFWFEAENISCYKNGYKVVKDLNLKLKYSENVILMGPNGSGKSSLIDLINRNIYPVLGNNVILKIFNKDLINLWELRKRISTVNSEIKNRINPYLTVFDLVVSGLYGKYCLISKKSERDISIAEDLISKMNLVNLSQKYFSYLSDGEKQIALIARALINNPEILILDEPIANLDYRSKFYVIDKINELSRLNTNILCITHDLTMITKIYDRVILLKDRSIIADGCQREILTSKNINKLFNINIDLIEYKGKWNIYQNSYNNNKYN